jgi:hypothetical protein
VNFETDSLQSVCTVGEGRRQEGLASAKQTYEIV